MAPGTRQNASQIDGPFPSASWPPSFWYAAVAVPNRNLAGKGDVSRKCRGTCVGAHADDRAATLIQLRHRTLRAEVRGAHVHVEELVVLGLGERERIARLRHARVVHEDVEPAELGRGLVDHAP